jgi:hypothetical protein
VDGGIPAEGSQPVRADDLDAGSAHTVAKSAIGRYEDHRFCGCSRDRGQGVVAFAGCVNDLDALGETFVDAATGCSFDHHDDRLRYYTGGRGGANAVDQLAGGTGSVTPPPCGP